MHRDLRVARPALTIAVALAVSIVATTVASGGASALLPTRAAVQSLVVLAVALVLGAVLTAVRERQDAARGRVLDLAAGAAALWTVLAATSGFLLYLEQAPALDSPAFGPGLVTFVFDVEIGRTWLIAAALAAVLTALLIAVRSRRGTAGLALATVVATVPVALQSAMSGDALAVERGVVAAGFVQLVTLAAWIGVALLRPQRTVAPVAFAALVLGIGAASSALAADGAITPLAVGGAVAVVLAGGAAMIPRAGLRSPQPVLLAIAVGLGAAAATTRTMPDVPARVTPAQILTGSPLPPAPSIGALLGAWQPDAVWLVVAAALVVGYLVALRRVQAPWPVVRTVSWLVGAVLLAWLTSGGPAVYGQVLVAVHLAQLAALLLPVPLLLAGGAPLGLLAAVRPSAVRGRRSRPVLGLLVAVVASVLLLGTGLLRWSLTDAFGGEVVILAALAAGGLLVGSISASDGHRRSAVVVAALLLVLEIAAAVVLATSGSLLVADWYGAMGWGTDALAAQRSGAPLVGLLLVLPTVVLLVAAIRSHGRAVPVPRPAEAVAA